MSPRAASTALRRLALLAPALLMGGCGLVVLEPTGDVALQQRNLIIASTALMLLVIVPVIAMTFLFAWRYRATNTAATYDPDWHHSTQLEVGIWAIPLLIIIALGAMTWVSTHTLDPFRMLGRLGPNRPVPAGVEPLEVQAVALDWKWLFIYPEQGIATVNELAAPVDRPIRFRITSASVWNTLSVPTLAGMIYAMPGMETRLHAVANREGTSTGMSAHYSGPGFSKMTFPFRALSPAGFDQWVTTVKGAPANLTRAAYLELERPTEAHPLQHFNAVEAGLFDAVVGLCVKPGQMCVTEMQRIDREGGDAANSAANRQRLEYDNRRLNTLTDPAGATFPASGRPPRSEQEPEGIRPHGAPPVRGPATSGEGGTAAPPQLNRPTPAPHRQQ